MDKIINYDSNAPLINSLVANEKGIPGKGISDYYRTRYGVNWLNLSDENKLALVAKERRKILSYTRWEKLNREIFGDLKDRQPLWLREGTEKDGKFGSGGWGGGGESPEHKRLKPWVAANPEAIGLDDSFGKGIIEAELLSGDVIDVLFQNIENIVCVEVKSILSNSNDFRRGIYQCVKYREVKRAEYQPFEINVSSMLITETKISEDLKIRCKLLSVNHRQVLIPSAKKQSNAMRDRTGKLRA